MSARILSVVCRVSKCVRSWYAMLILGGGLHRSRDAPNIPIIIFLFESCFPMLSVARTRRLKTSCSDMTFAHELDAIDFVLLYTKCLWGHFAQDLCRWYSSQARRSGKTFVSFLLVITNVIHNTKRQGSMPKQLRLPDLCRAALTQRNRFATDTQQIHKKYRKNTKIVRKYMKIHIIYHHY